jgi:hypothetical protein
MGAMDARRLELYELLKPTLGEDPARKLVLALPAQPDELTTKGDLLTTKADLEQIVLTTRADLERTMGALKEEMGALKEEMHVRFAQMDARFERLENILTRRMVAILGSWTVVMASAFAWAGAVLR